MRKTKDCGSYCGLSWWRDPYKANSSRTKASSSPNELCRQFSLAVIRTATNNFDDSFIIGEGSFGKVYKGYIDGRDTMVAIKRLSPRSWQGAHEFNSEIELLSKIRHLHIVSLIGYCDDKGEMILVYDYMSNGSLSDHLCETDNDPLPWKQRLEICIGAAKGLHYLHRGVKQTIIHRGVKTKDILLDEKWVAKISDFGLSKMGPSGMPNTAVSMEIAGTVGYIDPEYLLSGELTEKSDVYSFGVVLLEILCDRKAVDDNLDEDQVFLTEWAQKCFQNGTLDQIMDPYLLGKISPVCLNKFVAIAKSCLRLKGIERPMMGDVVEGLEFALQLQESADDAAASEEGDGEAHNEYIYRGMSFSESFGTCRNNVASRQGGRVFNSSTSISRPSFHSDRALDISQMKEEEEEEEEEEGEAEREIYRERDIGSEIRLRVLYAMRGCQNFSLAMIRTATNNFDNASIMGRGGFSNVCKGYIDGRNTTVAIRRYPRSRQGAHEFETEIVMLSELRHRHIVSLIGYCNDKREMFLVYDYMSNGSLGDHLCETDNDPLPWKQRLEICIGAAKGLHYLHTGLKQTIIHRDVNTANILLDEKWEAKISDFAVSLMIPSCRPNTAVSTENIMGKIGCIDPEYLMSGQLTVKSDVYSFGVVLLEVLCARRAVFHNLDGDLVSLADWAKKCIQNRTLDQIIDPYLLGTIAPVCLNKFVAIAMSCLRDNGIDRPMMGDVVESLEFISGLSFPSSSGFTMGTSTSTSGLSFQCSDKSEEAGIRCHSESESKSEFPINSEMI